MSCQLIDSRHQKVQLPSFSQSHTVCHGPGVSYLLLLLCRPYTAIQQGSETVLIHRIHVALYGHACPGILLYTPLRAYTNAQLWLPDSESTRPAISLKISNR